MSCLPPLPCLASLRVCPRIRMEPQRLFIQTTKPLDVSNMDIVFRGKVWSHSEDPTSKNVIHLLERDESIVTWLQPKGGKVEDQVPAINVKNQFYRGITLKMQKSIWRHVRLKKGFINLESLSQVGLQFTL